MMRLNYLAGLYVFGHRPKTKVIFVAQSIIPTSPTNWINVSSLTSLCFSFLTASRNVDVLTIWHSMINQVSFKSI